MNTLMNLKKLVPAGIVLCTMLLASSCQQDGILPDPVPDANEEEILARAGEIHNGMIDHYYGTRHRSAPFGPDQLAEVLDLCWEYLDLQGYDISGEQECRAAIEDRFRTSYLKGTPRSAFSVDTATFVRQLTETGKYSRGFVGEVEKLLALAHQKDDRELIREYVNGQFAEMAYRRATDRKARDLFIRIFNGSYRYWQTRPGNGLKSADLEPGSWVIINDGIGGVLGSVFGPLGSVVVATAFSVATNEEVNN